MYENNIEKAWGCCWLCNELIYEGDVYYSDGDYTLCADCYNNFAAHTATFLIGGRRNEKEVSLPLNRADV